MLKKDVDARDKRGHDGKIQSLYRSRAAQQRRVNASKLLCPPIALNMPLFRHYWTEQDFIIVAAALQPATDVRSITYRISGA
jgi:hypothetical protein